ncbi:MAG: hypothetical protein P8N43_15360 [Alphaproteobacteria bacterium]|jgi:hypothetical protein|nr:hypothetical protein [Alphaproteobacteria bacterium]
MKNIPLILGAGLTLSACAGAVPWNPQGYAGINMLEAEFQDPEGVAGPTSLKVVGGKEQESIYFKTTLPDGTTAEYSAVGVKAFDGQNLRAALEGAVSDDVKAISPDIVNNILRAVTGVVVP